MCSVGNSSFKIGVDGGGTKTECILIDEAGTIVAHHLAPGCNPNVAGTEAARAIVTAALSALISSPTLNPQLSALSSSPIVATQLFMSGAPTFWQEFAASLNGYGRVTAAPDSLPTLELATAGAPGLVLHAGTGSFVAARSPDGAVHYAGGTGWRFGDPGSGYELGRRAIARALLELQGWLPASRLGSTVRDHTQLGATAGARAITRFFYAHAEPNRVIAALAPAVLRLAAEGELLAHPVLKRYLVRRAGTLTINKKTVAAEAKLDGKFLLSCTDDNLPAADAARLFKGLLDVERGFRDLKSVLEVRPVYHRKQDRIKAHVTLCFLALVLIRVAEHHTGATWPAIARELDRIHAIDLAGTAGTVRQRTEITPDAQAILDACTVPAPPLILATAPANPPRRRARKKA